MERGEPKEERDWKKGEVEEEMELQCTSMLSPSSPSISKPTTSLHPLQINLGKLTRLLPSRAVLVEEHRPSCLQTFSGAYQRIYI